MFSNLNSKYNIPSFKLVCLACGMLQRVVPDSALEQGCDIGVKNYSKPHNVCIHSLVFGWMVSLGSRWLCKIKEDFLPYFGQGAEDKSKIFFCKIRDTPCKVSIGFWGLPL